MSAPLKLSELPTGSIQITTRHRMVRIDDAVEETSQCYLTIEGSPEGLRWLARHLNSLATTAENSDGAYGNIVAPWDFQNEPIKLEEWDSIDFHCKVQVP
jgi:hypothetical protein